MRGTVTGDDHVKYSSSYPSYMFMNGEIQLGINEKLEKFNSEISSNIAKFEPASKNARYVQ